MSVEQDVTFSAAGEMELKLDIYRPKGESKRAAILFFHGGGWRGGTKAGMRGYAEALAEYGFVGIPSQYRLLGQAPFPAQINDVKAAIRWTRANAAKLDIDPDKIALFGASAGAHLTLLAAGTPNDPRFEGDGSNQGVSSAVGAAIALFPPTGFYHGAPSDKYLAPATNLLGEGYSAEAAHAASPITYVSENYPPTLFLHGTQDRVVHHAHSIVMHDALRAAKAKADVHLFHGHNHEFVAIPSVKKLVMAEVAYFLDRSMIDPEKYRAEAEEFSMFARRAAEERRAQAPAAQ